MRRRVEAAVEVLGWWAGLTVLWIMLIGPVDELEAGVGTVAALAGAGAARGARRAARG
ncbi:hypothetical protein [Streptomyces caatingaensis]|uniref:hypothetical protein n=1 Tax=Streptomyces caatingaensis TaxID=1678637 RepID=UPI0018E3990E|nr:hypothetical protein [Streptomyces caatingaensis]